jgi:hypothetical protein
MCLLVMRVFVGLRSFWSEWFLLFLSMKGMGGWFIVRIITKEWLRRVKDKG